MKLNKLLIGLLSLTIIVSCSLFHKKLRLPSPEQKKSQQAVAAQIFDYQTSVNQCAKTAAVTRIELDASKDDFVKDISDACTHQELILLSRYWFCFQKQLVCPVKWAAAYQKAGDNCLPIPKLSKECCSVYEADWTENSGKTSNTCGK